MIVNLDDKITEVQLRENTLNHEQELAHVAETRREVECEHSSEGAVNVIIKSI